MQQYTVRLRCDQNHPLCIALIKDLKSDGVVRAFSMGDVFAERDAYRDALDRLFTDSLLLDSPEADEIRRCLKESLRKAQE